MTHKIENTAVEVTKGDITMLEVEAIVNPANNGLVHAGGLAASIVKRGGQIIQQESRKIGYVTTGSAAITQGGHLKAKHVIHAVGPRYKDGKSGEAEKLASAVKSSIDIAEKKKLKTLAIPAISSGIFGYPIKESAKIIVDTVVEHLNSFKKEKKETTLEKVVLCLFDEETFNIFEKELEKHFKKNS
ncbi:MAG TPA: macro domain-containing protein [Ignavibacteria bacterium]|jgi:O-acetyl-ADP-ribose deacetylase (regulator of RNase III)